MCRIERDQEKRVCKIVNKRKKLQEKIKILQLLYKDKKRGEEKKGDDIIGNQD